jgi:hypothetical protein
MRGTFTRTNGLKVPFMRAAPSCGRRLHAGDDFMRVASLCGAQGGPSRVARRTRQHLIRTLQSYLLIQRGRGTGPVKPRQPSAAHDGTSTVGA